MSKEPPASPSSLFRNSVISSFQRSPSKDDTGNGESFLRTSSYSSSALSRQAKASSIIPYSRSRTRKLAPGELNSASQFGSKPLVRRRSSLFGNLSTKSRSRMDKSDSSSRRKNSQSALFEDNDVDGSVFVPSAEDESNIQPPAGFRKNNQKSASLFGAVMRKFAGPSDSPSAIPTTPTRSTRDSTTAEEKPPLGLMSPSGNSIMNMVNRFVMNSPFRFNSPKAKRRLLPASSAADDSRSSLSNQSTTRLKRRKLNLEETEDSTNLLDDKNWQEAPVVEKQMLFVDWSLRRTVRLECHPPSSLQTIIASQEWKKQLIFWQYPATPDTSCPPSSFQRELSSGSQNKKAIDVPKDNPSQLDPSTAVSLSYPATDLASRLIRSVNGRTAYITKNTSEGDLGSSQHNKIIMKVEWQEALRSLYLKWCEDIERLATESIVETVLDCYFYCVAQDHLVLFRVDATENESAYVPRVLLSSCSQQFQKELMTMGVKEFTYLNPGETGVDGVTLSSSEKESNLPTSPTVKADLEALRRAQAFGQSAGADVYVTSKLKQSRRVPSRTQQLAPMSVCGFDDVSLFFEVYLNSFGLVNTKSLAMPTMFCRSLGPFLHATMKSLKVYPVKQEKVVDVKAGRAIEIEGVIMPCVMRKMVASAARSLTSYVGQSHTRALGSDDIGGSQFFVLHSIDEKYSGNLSGAQSSTLFNDLAENKLDCSAVSTLPHKCPHGTSLQLVVWDQSRAQVAACKVEPRMPDPF